MQKESTKDKQKIKFKTNRNFRKDKYRLFTELAKAPLKR